MQSNALICLDCWASVFVLSIILSQPSKKNHFKAPTSSVPLVTTWVIGLVVVHTV